MKELRKEIKEEVVEEYAVEENNKGRADEPQWIIKKEDNKTMKEGGM